MRHGSLSILAFPLLVALACTPQRVPAPPATSISAQVLQDSSPRQRTSLLLDFESSRDLAFVDTIPTKAQIDLKNARSGSASLLLAGEGVATIKLSSLLRGRKFPGDWTLLCVDVGYAGAETIVVTLKSDGRTIAAETFHKGKNPGVWEYDRVRLSLTRHPELLKGNLTLEIAGGGGGFFVDRLALVDDTKTLVSVEGSDGWTVTEAGRQIVLAAPNRFELKIADRWKVDEANKVRTALLGEDGIWSMYADGRAYRQGRYEPILKLPDLHEALQAAHESPAEIEVSDDQGRVDRTTGGDVNNDGYNESLGAYQVRATAAAVAVKFIPRAPVVMPVLQISGLPDGEVLVTLEGRLLERVIRLKDGTLLIDLRVRFDRPVVVDVRVK